MKQFMFDFLRSKSLRTFAAAYLAVALLGSDSKAQGHELNLDPLARSEWTRAHAKHLLERAGFGGSENEIDKLYKLGPRRAVKKIVSGGAVRRLNQFEDFEHSGIFDNSLEPFPPSRPALTRMAKKTGAGLGIKVRDGVNRPLQPIVNKFFYWLRASRLETDRVVYWWANEMLVTDHPLKEKLALFWHGHFAVNEDKVRDYRKMLGLLQLLRENGLGSAQKLVELVSKSPAMLVFLDAGVNTKNAPNENFAREIMEMFTLGDGQYTEIDVREAARAFTGWKVEGLDFHFNRAAHDFGSKTFMGETDNFTGEQIVDEIFTKPATAQYLAAKLYQFFVDEKVSPSARQQLGVALAEEEFDVGAYLRRIFMSRAFYADAVIGNRIKGPVELMISTYRKVGLTIVPGSPDFNYTSEAMGQRLMHPPTVAGWAGGRSWINPSLMFERSNFVLEVVFPNIGFVPPDRAPPFIAEITKVQNRLRKGMSVSQATSPTGVNNGMMAESNKNADRDEEFNTRLGTMRGWQMALERVKPIDRSVARLDLTAFVKRNQAQTVNDVVALFERHFFSVALSAMQKQFFTSHLKQALGSDVIDFQASHLEEPLRELLHKMLSTPEYQVG
ncbi:MAG TPA: DUF1800 domain-containing protein [Rhodobiaceae bacterium]|nr:DUF1800 domain-containing protein [Rhodobiaceae bacterium]